MWYGNRYIGVNIAQLKDWARFVVPGHSVRKGAIVGKIYLKLLNIFLGIRHHDERLVRRRAMEVRCILHEVGHLLLQPELLDRETQNQTAEPKQEESPWVFVCAVLGIALGDYSFRCRTDGTDDSPQKPLWLG